MGPQSQARCDCTSVAGRALGVPQSLQINQRTWAKLCGITRLWQEVIQSCTGIYNISFCCARIVPNF